MIESREGVIGGSGKNYRKKGRNQHLPTFLAVSLFFHFSPSLISVVRVPSFSLIYQPSSPFPLPPVKDLLFCLCLLFLPASLKPIITLFFLSSFFSLSLIHSSFCRYELFNLSLLYIPRGPRLYGFKGVARGGKEEEAGKPFVQVKPIPKPPADLVGKKEQSHAEGEGER